MTQTHNQSNDEIAKFDALAKTWWDPNGPMKPLHQLNPIRLRYILDRIQSSWTPDQVRDDNNAASRPDQTVIPQRDRGISPTILDVGCGAGLLSEALAKTGAQVTGLDLSDEALSTAKAHAKIEGLTIDYQPCAIEDVKGNTFDVITCMEMLEHVPNPQGIIQECKRLLKPGGLLFLSTMNRNAKAYLLGIIGAEYIARMLPIGTHDYDKFIKPSELLRWCRDAGFSQSHLQGVRYQPLNQTFTLSDDVSVNYMVGVQNG